MKNTRVEGLLAELCMQVPDLAPALARLELDERPHAELKAVDPSGHGICTINLDGKGVIAQELLDDSLEDAKMVIAHEGMHLITERAARIKDLAGPAWDDDWNRANRAMDRWINQILIDLGVCTREQVVKWNGCLPEAGREEWDLMDHWRAERPPPKNQKPKPMAGCAPEGSGDPEDGDGEEGDQSKETPEEAVQRQQEAHSALAGMATHSAALRKMVTPPPPVVRWQDVLAEAAAAARGAGISQRPRVTRAKWGRRSTEDVPKPGKASKRPQLVVVVDVSGSMSGLLEEVVAETDQIGKHSHVHLVLHDSAVLFSGQYKKGRDHIRPCGGTDFSPAIREAGRVVKEWPGRSVVVHLTDGMPCGEWPDVPADFSAGYAGIFGGYEIKGPGRWRTRRCDPPPSRKRR